MKIFSLFGAVIFSFSTTVFSHDSWQASHSCYKPIKPFEFTSQWEVDMFNNEVQEYKYCIERFVSDQKEAIRTHSRVLDEAVDEWNNFVNFELNM